MTDEPVVSGWCDPRFAAVRSEFTTNFRERGELGAGVCVSVHGRVVANLHGDWRDSAQRQPWTADTLVNVFSVGKGLLAACAARLIGERRLNPDSAVARYWPEFAAAGKAAVTVRELLSHQAGVPAIREPLPAGSALDWPLMTRVLAGEEPWWPPGTGHGYHVNTFGFVVGELIRRVAGLTPGRFLARELAGPLRADVHFGLAAREHADGPRCFGHFGAGGSVGFADPDSGLAFGYVTSQMGPRWRNPRNQALMDACYAGL